MYKGEKIGERLNSWIRHSGYRKQHVAEKAGFSYVILSYYINNKREAKEEHLNAVAKVLGIDLNTLLTVDPTTLAKAN